MNKIVSNLSEAVEPIHDGASIMIAGFGGVGTPYNLLNALIKNGVKDLTVIHTGAVEALPLIDARMVKRRICSYASTIHLGSDDSKAFQEQYKAGLIELEIFPMGTLIEKVRAGGAGIPMFYIDVGIKTNVTEERERRLINGREYILETALRADFALIRAYKADTLGNLVYRFITRNCAHEMATAADFTIAEVEHIVKPGQLDPETIITPGIYVDRVVQAVPIHRQWKSWNRR